jgi:hypothetical protein
MNRFSLGLVAAITFTGCGPKEFGSQCDQPNAPAECMQACDPSPSAPATCPDGYHCAPDGMCDKQCTTAADCGSGYECTSDGRCVDDGTPVDPPIDMNCPNVTFTPMPTTPSIGLVLDQSGSMFDGTIDGGSIDSSDCATDPTCRYTAMRAALTGPSGVVTQLQSKAYFGHNQYTCNGDPSALALKTTNRALNNASAIDAQLAMGTPANSFNTPTHAAISAMVASFVANPPPADSPPVIVLATDGLPNSCQSGPGANGGTDATVAAAQAAYNTAVGGHDHIPVYVLAMNTSSTHFQEVANVGQGAPRTATGASAVPYFPVSSAAQLQAAFQTIINGVISCDLSLTASIDATQAMNGMLSINGQQLQYGSDWILVGGNIIRVQGQACTNLKSSANPTISASVPCGSIIQ